MSDRLTKATMEAAKNKTIVFVAGAQ
jgi:hypothetical protein